MSTGLPTRPPQSPVGPGTLPTPFPLKRSLHQKFGKSPSTQRRSAKSCSCGDRGVRAVVEVAKKQRKINNKEDERHNRENTMKSDPSPVPATKPETAQKPCQDETRGQATEGESGTGSGGCRGPPGRCVVVQKGTPRGGAGRCFKSAIKGWSVEDRGRWAPKKFRREAGGE